MHALVAEVYAVGDGGGGHAGALRRVRPGALRGRRRRRQGAATDALVAWLRTQAKDRSGIWRDIAVRRRPTEVPTHYRPVLAAAARHGIPVPGLERLVAQIGELEAGAAMDEARIAALGGCAAVNGVACRRPPSTAVDVAASARMARRPPSGSSWTTSSPTPSWRRRATTSRCWPRGSRTWRSGWSSGSASRRPARTTSPRTTATSWCSSTPASGTGRCSLLAHYDTVWSAGRSTCWPVRVDGDRISGPGVFDMKGGLVQAVWAVRALRAGRPAAPPAAPAAQRRRGDRQPVLAPADRAGLRRRRRGAGVRGQRGRRGEDRAQGRGIFEVHRARGRVARGLDPEAGASAVDEIARVVQPLHAASRPGRGTTVNVGVVRGGTRANVVAG